MSKRMNDEQFDDLMYTVAPLAITLVFVLIVLLAAWAV